MEYWNRSLDSLLAFIRIEKLIGIYMYNTKEVYFLVLVTKEFGTDNVLELEKSSTKWEIQYPENRKKVQSILLLFDAWPPKYAGPVCAIYQDN